MLIKPPVPYDNCVAVVAAFNQEKALVGAFSVNLPMELFQALHVTPLRAGVGWDGARVVIAGSGTHGRET